MKIRICRWMKMGMVVVCLVAMVCNTRVVQAMNTIPDTTAETTADATTEDTTKQPEAESGSLLYIDNSHLYKGMAKTYAKGYVPTVKKGKVEVVLPLLSKGDLKGNTIKTSLTFGEMDNCPFERKNYEKDVALANIITEDGAVVNSYLTVYALKLKKDRWNGSYPVIISVKAQDKAGNEVQQDFVVYVTIKDGKTLTTETQDGADTATTEAPTFAPKVMIESVAFSKDAICPGDSFQVDLHLKNTSKQDIAKNMLVTLGAAEQFELESASDSVYVEQIGVGKTEQISYQLRVRADVAQGQYVIPVTMDYADAKGNTYTAQGTVPVTVGQLMKVELDTVAIPKEIQMGETIATDIQVMNLGRGKVYNVRAIIEADGLVASKTAFIGDMEAGTAMSGSTELTAEGKSGKSLYGKTSGTITVYYEDEAGNESQIEQNFETSILSPLNEQKDEQKVDDPTQWWILIVFVVIGIGVGALLFGMRKRMANRTETAEETDEDKE